MPEPDDLVRVAYRDRPRRRDVRDLPGCRSGLGVELFVDLASAYLIAAALADVLATVGEVEQIDLHAVVPRLAGVEFLQDPLRFLRSFRKLGGRARVDRRRRVVGDVDAV